MKFHSIAWSYIFKNKNKTKHFHFFFFSLLFQILEQEKHILRRKVDNVEGEYESKVSELQSDVADLRRALDEQQNNVKMAERQKSSIITQLTEQNQRLTAQLKEVNY